MKVIIFIISGLFISYCSGMTLIEIGLGGVRQA